MATKPTTAAKSGFQHRDNSGSMFFDAPGAPTLQGSIFFGGATHKVTAEPAVDKNQKSYLRVTGEGVSGGLWPNETVQNEKSPDYRGPIEISGQKKRVAAWKKPIKTGEHAGTDFLSLAISDPLPPRE